MFHEKKNNSKLYKRKAAQSRRKEARKIDVGFINLLPIRANHYLHQSVA